MAYIRKKSKFWTVCYRKNGKLIERSLKTTNRKIAQFEKNKIENEQAQGHNPILRMNVPLRTAFEEFKAHRKGRITPRTDRTDNTRIQFFIDEYPRSTLGSVTESMLKEHLDRRIKRDGITHTTANHTIRVMKTFLTFCVRKKYVFENPLRFMEKYKRDKFEARYLSKEEIDTILEAAKGTRAFPVLMVAIYTGMRYGEIKNLKPDDIDFKHNRIIVRMSKSGRFRHIPIHEDLLPILKAHSVDLTHFKGLLAGIQEKTGVKHFRFHDLRHTYISMLIKNNVNIATVKELAGHENIATTMNYIHLYKGEKEKAMKNFKIC